jgi:hypothetical protein
MPDSLILVGFSREDAPSCPSGGGRRQATCPLTGLGEILKRHFLAVGNVGIDIKTQIRQLSSRGVF